MIFCAYSMHIVSVPSFNCSLRRSKYTRKLPKNTHGYTRTTQKYTRIHTGKYTRTKNNTHGQNTHVYTRRFRYVCSQTRVCKKYTHVYTRIHTEHTFLQKYAFGSRHPSKKIHTEGRMCILFWARMLGIIDSGAGVIDSGVGIYNSGAVIYDSDIGIIDSSQIPAPESMIPAPVW